MAEVPGGRGRGGRGADRKPVADRGRDPIGPQRIVDLAAALGVAPSTAGRMPEDAQRAAAEALLAFADAAGEIPGSQWPSPVPAGEAPRPRVPGHRGHTDEGDRA